MCIRDSPHLGEVGVVNELYFLEAVKHGFGDVVRDVALGQLAGELQPALGRVCQLAQDNGPRDSCGVRVAVQVAVQLGGRTRAAAVPGPVCVVNAGGRIP